MLGCWLFPLPSPNSHPEENRQGEFNEVSHFELNRLAFLISGNSPGETKESNLGEPTRSPQVPVTNRLRSFPRQCEVSG